MDAQQCRGRELSDGRRRRRYALDYTKADFSYTPILNGKPGTPVDASWDLATQGGTLTTSTNLAPGGPAVAAQYFLTVPGVSVTRRLRVTSTRSRSIR